MNIQKSPLITEGKYQIIFTQTGIVYLSLKIKNEIPWNKINSCEENGNSIYLHIEKNRLLDVFSEELNGKNVFEEMKLEINKRIKKK